MCTDVIHGFNDETALLQPRQRDREPTCVDVSACELLERRHPIQRPSDWDREQTVDAAAELRHPAMFHYLQMAFNSHCG